VPGATTLSAAQQRADAMRAELPRRKVHPDVLHFCRAELVQQNCLHAVLERAKSVAEKLRDLSDLQGDGTPLVDAACSLPSAPMWHSTLWRPIGSGQSRPVSPRC
jgi:hypothetical protein